MELIQLLTQNLGVDEGQAQGGAGLIFKLAQEKLASGEFSQLANVVPGVQDLIGQAPETETGMAGALGDLVGAMSGNSQLADLASLAGGFGKLGLSPNMVSEFIPIIMSFVQNQGGDGIQGLLAQVLK
jgi:hypothetical protein